MNTADLGKDPTMPRTGNEQCLACGCPDVVFTQANLNTREKPFTIYFVCCACNFRWKGKEKDKAQD